MNSVDKNYLEVLENILNKGITKKDRTGTGTISIFDTNVKYSMKEGFPLLTSKKMFLKGIIYELLWFLGNHMKDEKYQKFGLTNIRYLIDNNTNIWVGDCYKKYSLSNTYIISKEEFLDKLKTDDDFCNKWGSIGPAYGQQWTNWSDGKTSINQIQECINLLKNDPDSRRIILNSWNVSQLSEMTLVPCHMMFQLYTREIPFNDRVKYWCDSLGKSIHYGDDMTAERLDELNIPKRYISLKWTQRSVDYFLGKPYNLSSYGLLLMIFAQEVNMIPETLSFSGGDTHLYLNHIDAAKEQLRAETFKLPKMTITKKPIFELTYEDFKLSDYQSSKTIKAELSN